MSSPDVQVTRLKPWELEVSVDVPHRPWRKAVSVHGKRRDAERAAAALRARLAREAGDAE